MEKLLALLVFLSFSIGAHSSGTAAELEITICDAGFYLASPLAPQGDAEYIEENHDLVAKLTGLSHLGFDFKSVVLIRDLDGDTSLVLRLQRYLVDMGFGEPLYLELEKTACDQN